MPDARPLWQPLPTLSPCLHCPRVVLVRQWGKGGWQDIAPSDPVTGELHRCTGVQQDGTLRVPHTEVLALTG
jgi:hypothetical protein